MSKLRTASRHGCDSQSLAPDSQTRIVMRPDRRKHSLSELVARITPKNRHRETDWGRPLGKESL
jgi:antitoxin component of MazEF toxin-antitoxin module